VRSPALLRQRHYSTNSIYAMQKIRMVIAELGYGCSHGWPIEGSSGYATSWAAFETLINRNSGGTCSSDGGAALAIEEVQPLEVYADPDGCALSYRGPAIQARRERPRAGGAIDGEVHEKLGA
jgi:hypothetical protein